MKKQIFKILGILGLVFLSNALAMTKEEYEEILNSYKLVDSESNGIYLNSTPLEGGFYRKLSESINFEDSTTMRGLVKLFKINEEITRLRISPNSERGDVYEHIRYPIGSSAAKDEYENIDIYDQRLYAVACLAKDKQIVMSPLIRSSSKDNKVLFKELSSTRGKYYETSGRYVSNYFDLELVNNNVSLSIDKPYEENKDFPYFNEEKILNKLYEVGRCDKQLTKEANIKVLFPNGQWIPQEESWNIESLENKE